jgi:hypothetical protein
MSRYMPSANRDDQFNVTGHYLGGLLVEILKRCGDDFSSANSCIKWCPCTRSKARPCWKASP